MPIEKQEKHVSSCYNSADVCTLQMHIAKSNFSHILEMTHSWLVVIQWQNQAVVQEQGNEGTHASVQDQATLLIYSTAWLSRAWVENEAFIMKRRPHKSCIGIKLSH